MIDRLEIFLTGTGGQGIVLAGVILADAAIRDNKYAVQTQNYGPEARGGASSSEVIVSSAEIDYPAVIEADIMLCMSQSACDKHYHRLRRNGLLIVDTANVQRAPTSRAVRANLTGWAVEVTGREITASVLALGFLVGLTELTSRQSLEQAVLARTPGSTRQMNLDAIARGFAEAAALKQRQ